MRAPLPQPRLGSYDADRDRASQFQRTVQNMDGDVHLGRPALIRARAQSITDQMLEPANGSLGSGTGGVPGGIGAAYRLRQTMRVYQHPRNLSLSRTPPNARAALNGSDCPNQTRITEMCEPPRVRLGL